MQIKSIHANEKKKKRSEIGQYIPYCANLVFICLPHSCITSNKHLLKRESIAGAHAYEKVKVFVLF